MTYSQITLEVRGPVAHLTLNRPEHRNAMTLEMCQELADASGTIAENGDVRAVLIRGSGSDFSVGGDVKLFAQRAGAGLPAYIRPMATALHLAIGRIARLGVPVVAAVQGAAAGGGLSLACSADFVIAADSARFTVAYTAIGFTLDGGSSYFLPRIVGMRRALELAMLNPILTAEEAKELALVTRVVPAAALDGEAASLAARLAAGPTQSLKAVKRLLREGSTASLETQLENETLEIIEAGRRADGVEGVRAFVERRPAKFRGV